MFADGSMLSNGTLHGCYIYTENEWSIPSSDTTEIEANQSRKHLDPIDLKALRTILEYALYNIWRSILSARRN